LAVSFFLIGIGIVSVATSSPLHLEQIGFSPENASTGILMLGIAGFFSTVLAFTGIFRFLFPLWAAVVVWLLIKAFFLSSVSFSGPKGFGWAVLLTIGAIGALLGALWVLKPRYSRT
jgi:hypothetical protein